MDQFVVRLWAPAISTDDAAGFDAGLRGVVSHIGSGRSSTFRDGTELLARIADLRSIAGTAGGAAVTPDDEAAGHPVGA
jgi:hypothetical protein